jgi:hypothetical protein
MLRLRCMARNFAASWIPVFCSVDCDKSSWPRRAELSDLREIFLRKPLGAGIVLFILLLRESSKKCKNIPVAFAIIIRRPR